MRGRSATVTRMSATTSTRTRSVSFSAALALVLYRHSDGPSLPTLPTEILLEIILTAAAVNSYQRVKTATSSTAHRLGSSADDDASDWHLRAPRLDYRTLRALALTSRQLAGLAHSIMYRNIALDQLKHTSLFARTILDCAHRDITLASTVSPVSPVSPTSMAFSYIPTLFAGKFTNRLAVEYPFSDSPRVPRNRHAEVERFHAATGALLGFGDSAPSVPSPVLADLRTLLIDSCVLEHHLKTHANLSSVCAPTVSPSPSELVLHSYIQWRDATLPSLSPLAPLGARLTHLTIACPSAKWTLPSTTTSALGGVPSLTHLALVRRAHANEDNDAEFVRDVAGILSERSNSLVRVVLVVLPDAGYSSWKYDHQAELSEAAENAVSDDDDEYDDTAHVLSLNPELRTLEAYLATTYIWAQFTNLARLSRAVCVVPGMGDAWTRALRKSRKQAAIFESNIFHDHGRDLWSWARAFETRRRAMERS